MNNDNMKKTQLAVKEAYRKNNKDMIQRIEDAVFVGSERKEFLSKHDNLSKLYEGVANTPLLAPNLFVKDEDFVIVDYVELVEKELGVDLSEYSLEDALTFAGFVWTKVHNFFDDEGNIKSTPNTEKAELPTIRNIRDLSDIELKHQKKVSKIYKKFNADTDSAEDLTLKIMKVKSETDELKRKAVFKISGINEEDLTDWEKDLLVQDVTSYSARSLNKGKSSFKGYLR